MSTQTTLLLTRPLHDSLALQSLLQSEGIHALIAPVLAIHSHSHAVKQLAAVPANKVQAVVATSRHAFTLLQAPPDYLDKKLYVVGETTAAAAIAQGWQEPTHIAHSSRTLQPVLKSLSPEDGHILYLRGEMVTTDLSHQLSDFTWHNIIAYQAGAQTSLSPTIVSALQENQVDGVILYSNRSAQLFEQAFRNHIFVTPEPIQPFCLSESIADSLTLSCWKDAIFPEQPSQHAMLSLIKRFHMERDSH